MSPDAPARCEGPPSPVCPPHWHQPWWHADHGWCQYPVTDVEGDLIAHVERPPLCR
jgi:hypothetical protein